MTDYAQIVSIPCSRLFEIRGVYLERNHLKYLRLLFHSMCVIEREKERERGFFAPSLRYRVVGSCRDFRGINARGRGFANETGAKRETG